MSTIKAGQKWNVSRERYWYRDHPGVITILRIDDSIVRFTPGTQRAGEDGVHIKNFPGLVSSLVSDAPSVKPESRWLDPASVPVGPVAMRRCLESLQAHIPCPYPVQTAKGMCLACLDRCETRQKAHETPVLPPSALTPAPKMPRREVLEVNRASGYRPSRWAQVRATPVTPRVRKVRAPYAGLYVPPGPEPVCRAEWVIF